MSVDHDEFTAFVAAHGRRLFRTAYLLAGSRHLGEDLAQTALGKLYASWSRVRRTDNPAAYAHTTLVRVYLDHRRRIGHELPTDSVPDRPVVDADVAMRIALLDALSQLSARDRAIVVLRYWDDLSVADTAAILNVRETVVRTRSQRALQKLRGLLASLASESSDWR